MNKFKVGDRIVVSSPFSNFEIGTKAIVERVFPNGVISIDLDPPYFKDLPWDSSIFELDVAYYFNQKLLKELDNE